MNTFRFLKILRAGFIFVAIILATFLVSDQINAASNSTKSGALASIPLAEFAKNTDYITKLIPGSDDPNAADYYARPSFYNSDAGKAKFDTVTGDVVTVYDGEVGFTCDILGIEDYLVDFTDVDLTDIPRNDWTSTGATYANGKAGIANQAATDVRTRAQKAAMLQNTLFLQQVEYCNAGSGFTITIPKGEYYFAIGHHTSDGSYIIKPVNKVNISGRGIGAYKTTIGSAIKTSDVGKIDVATQQVNGKSATILKPYTPADYAEAAAPDMFFYNEYSLSNFQSPSYLTSVHYSDFIIDGEDAVGLSYTSGGKGFMINLFEDVSWDFVVVRNTDGTGFGVDSPKGKLNMISNCLALNNGKKATPNDGNEYPGASGFGIGTGYGDNERLVITDSVAYGNAKFGFFFEHQNRFQRPTQTIYPYNATRGASNAGQIDISNIDTELVRPAFEVKNTLGVANYYNYGGMRAYDMIVDNSTSVSKCTENLNSGTYYQKVTCTVDDIYYSADTRRVNVDIDVSVMFTDVQDKSEWYYDAIKWAVEKGIVYGVGDNYFGIGQQIYRKDALVIIWRMMGYPGDVVTKENGNQSTDNSRLQHIDTCFDDVPPETYVDERGLTNVTYFAPAVKWAYEDRYNPNSNAEAKGRIIIGKKRLHQRNGRRHFRAI